MSTKYATNEKKPSRMFAEVLQGGGSSSVYCNCGRQHYAPENLLDSVDPDDYELMLAEVNDEQKRNPEGVVIHSDTSFVHAKDIDGKTFVLDCPCNGLRKYEEWVWNNREIIRDYYKVRVEQEHRWAEQEILKNKLAGI